MQKLKTARHEITEAETIRFFGKPDADVTIVSWGSTKGPILDAMPKLETNGISVNYLQIHILWPFPSEAVARILGQAKIIIDIEMNFTGQLADLIRRETGIQIRHRILKYNGRPISETEVIQGITEVVQLKSERVVLTHGL